jgi:hypothetical protein
MALFTHDDLTYLQLHQLPQATIDAIVSRVLVVFADAHENWTDHHFKAPPSPPTRDVIHNMIGFMHFNYRMRDWKFLLKRLRTKPHTQKLINEIADYLFEVAIDPDPEIGILEYESEDDDADDADGTIAASTAN